MAINDLINESWQGHDHGEVEAALKAVLTQLLDAVERIPQGGISIDELSDSLKTLISNAVPNTRKVNNKELSSDITLGAADVGALPANTVIPEGVTVDSVMSSTSEHAVQNKVIKAYVDAVSARIDTLIGSGNVQGAIDTFNEVTAFLAGISSSDTLAAKLALLVPQSRTINSKPLTGNINIGINDIDGLAAAIANAGSGAVSVTTNEDGTFVIHVGDTDYTINLNHTHENMAKIVKCTEATLPQTLENDTIYVQVDNANTPNEIESLWLFGLEFTGGGFAPGTPRIVHPSGNTQINIGNTVNGSVSYTLNIKAKDITQPLIVEFGSGSTGYSFDTSNLPTGVTYDSNTGQLTITAAAATNINGVDIVVVYTGRDTDDNAEGTLGISSSSVDGINVEVTLVANKVQYQMIADWEGVDEPSLGEWIDRINNISIGLYGTTAKVSDGYRLDNTSAPKKAWCYPSTSQTSFFNAQIDKEFLCIIDCKVKFAAADKRAMVIDFGAFGDSQSGLSFNFRILQNGSLNCMFKKISDSEVFSDKVTTSQTGISFPIDTYVDIHIKMGVHILRNGKQELFCECGSGRAYAVLDTPVTVNFKGVNAGNPPITAAFGLAIAYMDAADAVSWAADYLSDVVYKKIQIFRREI